MSRLRSRLGTALTAFCVLALNAPGGDAPSPQQEGSPPELVPGQHLEARLRALLADEDSLTGESVAWLEGETALVLDRLGRSKKVWRHEILSLLDVVGLGLAAELEEDTARKFRSPTLLARELGERVLEELVRLDPEGPVLSTATREVLILPERHSLPRRRAALELILRTRTPAGLLALLTVCRSPSDPLRRRALMRLASWPAPASDLFLVRQLGRPRDRRGDPHPFTVLLERVRSCPEPLATEASRVLAGRLAMSLLGADWRECSRSIELARALPLAYRVPLLIDALRSWGKRAERGEGSRRIEGDLVRELRELSGREIGASARRWQEWWVGVRRGEIPLEPGADVEPLRTAASFFGLRPQSDRLTFVIDRSGSMSTRWATSEHNRYEEAIEQMLRFLQASGEETRFNVVLFNGGTRVSGGELRPATARVLESARGSLLRIRPEGDTMLRSAVQRAMRISRGQMDLDALEADTIVVLCDGETEEGPSWVGPTLERHNAEARLRFYCVLIGSRGDGTLEALAEGTDGGFLRLGG